MEIFKHDHKIYSMDLIKKMVKSEFLTQYESSDVECDWDKEHDFKSINGYNLDSKIRTLHRFLSQTKW